MSDNTEQRPYHLLDLTLNRRGWLTASWSCDAPEGADCRLECPERCDAWGEAGQCEHESIYRDSGECRVLPWLESATWDETYSGAPTQVRSGRVVVEWDGDGYTWHYAEEAHR